MSSLVKELRKGFLLSIVALLPLSIQAQTLEPVSVGTSGSPHMLLLQDDTAEITLRVRSYTNLALPLSLTTHSQVDAGQRLEYFGLGIFFGALLIMFGYNLVLPGFLREFGYLFLCLFMD